MEEIHSIFPISRDLRTITGLGSTLFQDYFIEVDFLSGKDNSYETRIKYYQCEEKGSGLGTLLENTT